MLLQFCGFTNPDNIPYKFPTVDAGDSTMGRGMPYQGHRTTIRCTTYDDTTYDVGRTTVQLYAKVAHAE